MLVKSFGSRSKKTCDERKDTTSEQFTSVLWPAILCPRVSLDRKMQTLARLSGVLNTLLAIIKMPNIPKDLLVGTLSALNAISKNGVATNEHHTRLSKYPATTNTSP